MGIITGDRGQSEVVGAILLFGIFILALGLLQTYFVPQEIAATEQNHVQEVSNDFTEMYASIGDAAGSNRERSASLSLGTRYGVSTVFLTPPPARGTLESEYVGDVDGTPGDEFSGLGGDLVTEVCGLSTVETNAITYEGQYNEYQNAGAHTYEAGVHYRITDGAGLRNNQRLVDDTTGVTTIHLTPITHGSIRESGTSREPITFKPGVTGDTGTFSVDEDDTPVTIRIPIQNHKGWDATFDGGIVSTPGTNTALLRLDSDSGSQEYRIRCTPIGINTDPENEPSAAFTGDADDEDEDEDSGSINPIGDGELILQSSSEPTNLDLANKADTEKKITQVRIPWAISPGGSDAKFTLTFGSETETVPVGGNTWTNTNGWTWSAEGDDDGGDVQSIGVSTKDNENDNGNNNNNENNNNGNGNPNDGYAIVVKFEDDTTSTYFVGAKKGNG